MTQLQTILALATFIVAVWFIILLFAESYKEKRWKLQQKNLDTYRKSQEKKRSTNKQTN